jgi:hypothetical protein
MPLSELSDSACYSGRLVQSRRTAATCHRLPLASRQGLVEATALTVHGHCLSLQAVGGSVFTASPTRRQSKQVESLAEPILPQVSGP